MPIFQFVCDKCGKHFERIIKHSEIDDVDCPACKSKSLFRPLTAHGSYTINGNNSASVTPKKFRKH